MRYCHTELSFPGLPTLASQPWPAPPCFAAESGLPVPWACLLTQPPSVPADLSLLFPAGLGEPPDLSLSHPFCHHSDPLSLVACVSVYKEDPVRNVAGKAELFPCFKGLQPAFHKTEEAWYRHPVEQIHSNPLYCFSTTAVRESSHVLPNPTDLNEDIPSPGQSISEDSWEVVVSLCCLDLFSAISKLVFSLHPSGAI